MLDKIEDFFLNRFAGKLIARAAVTVAAYLASGVVGVHINVDPNELAAAITLAAHGAFEWFRARRAKNPASPAVQTDATKPGYVVPPPPYTPPGL